MGGNHGEAAKAYYDSELKGGYMNAQIPDGDIRIEFTGNGWQHLKANMKGDPVKAALTPQIPSIIHEGEYFNVPLYKEHGSIVKFHSYRKKVDTAEGPRMVIVDVAQQSPRHQPQYFPYALTREGGYGYEKRMAELRKKQSPQPADAGLNLRRAGGLCEKNSHKATVNTSFEVVNLYFEDELMQSDSLGFDAKSARSMDENGFLHVAVSHISKETVNPYYGREIPGWEELGLDPERVYASYRKGEELAKAAPTFNGLPLLRDHHFESAENPQKEFRIGTLGTDAAYRAPYLDNSLIITDAAATAAR